MDQIDQVLRSARSAKSELEQLNILKTNLPGVALELSKSTHAGPKVLGLLSRHRSITVRHEVAKNPKTPRELLEIMAKDKDMLVRDYAQRTLNVLGGSDE